MSTEPAANEPKGFPFVTVGASLGVLFAFLALTVIAYRSPSFLDPTPDGAKAGEPPIDAAAKMSEVRARNEGALNGVGAKMPLREAHKKFVGRDADGKFIGTLKGPNDTLPFPLPEAPVAPPAKKDEPKKDEKAKQ